MFLVVVAAANTAVVVVGLNHNGWAKARNENKRATQPVPSVGDQRHESSLVNCKADTPARNKNHIAGALQATPHLQPPVRDRLSADGIIGNLPCARLVNHGFWETNLFRTFGSQAARWQYDLLICVRGGILLKIIGDRHREILGINLRSLASLSRQSTKRVENKKKNNNTNKTTTTINTRRTTTTTKHKQTNNKTTTQSKAMMRNNNNNSNNNNNNTNNNNKNDNTNNTNNNNNNNNNTSITT